MPDQDALTHARAAFGWSGDIRVTRGPRGALGELWHVEVGRARYALKESHDEPPTEEWIDRELAFGRVVADAGVRIPTSYPDKHGRYLVPTPHGTWLRCYEWIDLRPLAPGAPDTAGRIGRLLARLHRSAPAAAREFDGQPPDRWYDTAPDQRELAGLLDAAAAPWAAHLAAKLARSGDLRAVASPADPAALVVCHRDLHPENVFTDPAGTLTVVDFDDAGPAAPSRELARSPFDWFCDGSGADLDAVRVMLTAYADAGGPGRVTGPSDFTMLLAGRLNFVRSQALLALDPGIGARRRAVAEREIALMLDLWPTRRQLDDVLAIGRTVFG